MIDTKKLRELADAATKGPWIQDGAGIYQSDLPAPQGLDVAIANSRTNTIKDAAYIVAACNAVPALLDELDKRRWVPVGKWTKDGKVLTLFKNGEIQSCLTDYGCYWRDGIDVTRLVTHVMPLPEPPEVER